MKRMTAVEAWVYLVSGALLSAGVVAVVLIRFIQLISKPLR